MSRIYFHSPNDTVEVRGPERHRGARICVDLTMLALAIDEYDPGSDPIRRVVELPEYARKDSSLRFSEHVRRQVMDFMSEGPAFLGPRGKVSGFTLSLNTAQAFGSDAVRLLARLHGQCEMHAYVEGRNRAWLAGIVKRGLESRVLRRRLHGYSLGWEDVVDLLEKRDDEPVVTSYSITEGFPNAEYAMRGGWESDDRDAFYDLSEEEQWRLAMAGLRDDEGYTVEIRPYDDEYGLGAFDRYRYGCGTNAFELREYADTLAGELDV